MTSIERDRLRETVLNMGTFGGSFVSALAEAWRLADDVNSAKLAAAFPNLLDDYAPEKWQT